MADPGWPWPGGALDPPAPDDALALACARLFATADGALLLAYLTRLTLSITLPPDATDARLRHLEGQRALVLSLRHLARRGGLALLPDL